MSRRKDPTVIVTRHWTSTLPEKCILFGTDMSPDTVLTCEDANNPDNYLPLLREKIVHFDFNDTWAIRTVEAVNRLLSVPHGTIQLYKDMTVYKLTEIVPFKGLVYGE